MDEITDDPNIDGISSEPLRRAIGDRYLTYALSTIMHRALPDARDGLKPVHRRILYAMRELRLSATGGFRKSAKISGDVMGNYHPHGDAAIYDAMARLAQDFNVRYTLVDGQGNFGNIDGDNPAASRYTEARMTAVAEALLEGLNENAVDFRENYDGTLSEPVVLPASFPNLLANGSSGIAVGMATNIPPHNIVELCDACLHLIKTPDARDDTLLTYVKGPDFPTGAQILGTRGIQDAYRTGRGSITMRAVVTVEEIQGRTCLVVTELPYQVNPDNLAIKIADLVKDGKLTGIADIRDETSGRTGQRLVIVLKRDAVAKVVLNNLYKHTQLQENFGANMLAIVDGVPRTLTLDAFITYWVSHQIDVIVRRTQFRLDKAEADAHILRGYLKALDALDDVIALIRKSPTVDEAKAGLIKLLGVDEDQAVAILNLQLRRLAALERQKIIDQAAELETMIADFKSILASKERQRSIVSEELSEITTRFGDDRRTEIMMGFAGEMSNEDLIPEEEMVVSVTRGGYIKRTRSDNYRSQHRGGKGVKGAQLRADDVVEHFFVTTTHRWLLFFTNMGRVYRAKAYEVPEAGRDAKGQHVANVLALQPGEEIAQILDIANYEAAQYLVLATKKGMVKKTALTQYDTNRSGGIIAINLKEEDELVAARLVDEGDDVLLVTKAGMSLRFSATDQALRPMGRSTAGVIGMHFRGEDHLLSASVINDEGFVFVVTEGGYAKRTAVEQYRAQQRGGLGIKVAKLSDTRGGLAGALIVGEDDEVLVVLESGKVVRSGVSEVPAKGRDTMGVVFARLDEEDKILGIARNSERDLAQPDDGSSVGEAETEVEAPADEKEPTL
mgnify:CR=1 FL=1